jgi:hypothetical protein
MLQRQIMSRYWNQDILGILRGAQNVINAMVKQQEVHCKQIWENSSVKSIVEEASSSVNRGIYQSLSQGSIQVSTYWHRHILIFYNTLKFKPWIWEWFISMYIFTLCDIVVCTVVNTMKMMGSSPDDWIY